MRKHKVSPVKPYKRFMDSKIDSTGMDPVAHQARFFMRENSIDVHRYEKLGRIPRSDPSCKLTPGKIPVGTTKCTVKIGMTPDAKLDRNALGIVP